jgi:hypothetical protein
MAHSILLQDWTTVRGSTTSTVVSQPVNGYADMTAFRNWVAYVDVSDASGSPSMALETSPTADNTFFISFDGTLFSPSVGVTTKISRYAGSYLPVARFLRWRISSSSSAPWSASFRIIVSATYNVRRSNAESTFAPARTTATLFAPRTGVLRAVERGSRLPVVASPDERARRAMTRSGASGRDS